jgi:hypothetical protein
MYCLNWAGLIIVFLIIDLNLNKLSSYLIMNNILIFILAFGFGFETTINKGKLAFNRYKTINNYETDFYSS